MSVNIKVTGGLNIEWGQIDPKATGGLKALLRGKNRWWHMAGRRVKGGAGQLESLQSVGQTVRPTDLAASEPSDPNRTWQRVPWDCHSPPPTCSLKTDEILNSLFRDYRHGGLKAPFNPIARLGFCV